MEEFKYENHVWRVKINQHYGNLHTYLGIKLNVKTGKKNSRSSTNTFYLFLFSSMFYSFYILELSTET